MERLQKQLDADLKSMILMEKESKDEVLTKELERWLDLKEFVDKKIEEVQKEKTELLNSTMQSLQALNKED